MTLNAARFKRRGCLQKETAELEGPAVFRFSVFEGSDDPIDQLNLYFTPTRAVWKDGVSVMEPAGAPSSVEKSFFANCE